VAENGPIPPLTAPSVISATSTSTPVTYEDAGICDPTGRSSARLAEMHAQSRTRTVRSRGDLRTTRKLLSLRIIFSIALVSGEDRAVSFYSH
jgi:hypothetical protein